MWSPGSDHASIAPISASTAADQKTSVNVPPESAETLHDLQARLDMLEHSRRSENIFNHRAEQVIVQVADLQFELVRIVERFDTS